MVCFADYLRISDNYMTDCTAVKLLSVSAVCSSRRPPVCVACRFGHAYKYGINYLVAVSVIVIIVDLTVESLDDLRGDLSLVHVVFVV